jgi:hypothetical protein
MTDASRGGQDGWFRLDGAIFGLIYGSITVLSLLMAMGPTGQNPFVMAAVLFGSVLAITLAKAFALVMEDTLRGSAGGSPPAASSPGDRPTFAEAWHHSRPVLVAANMPALIIGGAGFGLLSLAQAILLAEVFTVGLLGVLGGRVGWVVGRRARTALLGALFTGGIGAALAGAKHILAAMKLLLH